MGAKDPNILYFYRIMRTPVYLGKCQYAGPYCWTCRLTLCVEGEKHLHDVNATWYDVCPRCGQVWHKEPRIPIYLYMDAGKDFNEKAFLPQKAIRECYAFTWAVHPDYLDTKKKVRDQYSRIFLMHQFRAILSQCAFQYFHLIGKDFF